MICSLYSNFSLFRFDLLLSDIWLINDDRIENNMTSLNNYVNFPVLFTGVINIWNVLCYQYLECVVLQIHCYLLMFRDKYFMQIENGPKLNNIEE